MKSVPDVITSELNMAISQAIANTNRELGEQEYLFLRNRVLKSEKIIKLLLSMKGGSLQKELYDAGIVATASAFVQQRAKISWTVLEEVLENFNKLHKDRETFKSYRVLAVDGTCINLARDPKADTFMQNKGNPKGYNQLHVNTLYDVLNKTYQHCVIQPQPRVDEIGALTFMLKWYDFSEKTLIVADRGYESYNVFANIIECNNTDFLIRIKQNQSALREIKPLPMKELDTDISFMITTTQTKADRQNGYVFLQTRKDKDRTYSSKTRAGRWDFHSPYFMKFRVVRFMLETGEYETLATSLPREVATLEEIKELYHSRWGIESAFREIKYSLGLVNLHSKKGEFARQEVYAAMIMSNFCSRIASQVTVQQNKKNIHIYKVNMKMAIYLCKEFYRAKNGNGKQLMDDIARYTEPVRPDRKDKRNIKAKSFVGFTYRISA